METEVRALKAAQGTEMANLRETVLSLLSQLKDPERLTPTLATIQHEASARSKVLVVLYGDGHVEVFGNRTTDARVVDIPRMQPSVVAEQFKDLLIKRITPRCYQPDQNLDMKLIANGNNKRMTIQEWEWWECYHENFRFLDKVAEAMTTSKSRSRTP